MKAKHRKKAAKKIAGNMAYFAKEAKEVAKPSIGSDMRRSADLEVIRHDAVVHEEKSAVYNKCLHTTTGQLV